MRIQKSELRYHTETTEPDDDDDDDHRRRYVRRFPQQMLSVPSPTSPARARARAAQSHARTLVEARSKQGPASLPGRRPCIDLDDIEPI